MYFYYDTDKIQVCEENRELIESVLCLAQTELPEIMHVRVKDVFDTYKDLWKMYKGFSSDALDHAEYEFNVLSNVCDEGKITRCIITFTYVADDWYLTGVTVKEIKAEGFRPVLSAYLPFKLQKEIEGGAVERYAKLY